MLLSVLVQRYKIHICCWNVRILLDLATSKCSERRTALVSRELGRLKIGIAALSETRLSEEDQLSEKGSGYSIFWVRKPKNEKCESGVAITIKSDLVENLHRPAGITDCIMKLRFPLPCGQFISIISVYATTLEANEEVNLAFYGALHEAITKIPVEGKLIILGEFNARVGKDWEMWDSAIMGLGKSTAMVQGCWNSVLNLNLSSATHFSITKTSTNIPGFIQDQSKAI